MEKRKRCCERAERMRKAYRRRLREEFRRCLSETEATAADSSSPVSRRSRQGDEDLDFSVVGAGFPGPSSKTPEIPDMSRLVEHHSEQLDCPRRSSKTPEV